MIRSILCAARPTAAFFAIGDMKSLLSVLALLLGIAAIAVAEPSISASLSETVTDVDHPVQLEIKIQNAQHHASANHFRERAFD